MRWLSIALDCDVFLADFVVGLLGIVEEVTGRRFAPTAVTGHDFAKALGLTRREASAVSRIIGSRRGFALVHFGIERVHHALDKAPYEADAFVDDRSANVSSWVRAWPGRAAVLWRTPHNGAEPTPVGAHSVACWDALYEVFRREALRLPGFSTEASS